MTDEGIKTSVRLLHPWYVQKPMSVVALGIVIAVSALHDRKARAPIVAIDTGIETPVRPHPMNASLPMVVTDEGIETSVRLVHPINADWQIAVTDAGIVTAGRLLQN